MVSGLHKKLFRDLKLLWAQVLTVALVVAAGVATLVSAMSTYQSLSIAKDSYYSTSHFADVFAELKRAPMAIEKQLTQIPGVSTVETRIVFDANLNLPGIPEPCVGRFVTLPDDRNSILNQLILRSGRWPSSLHSEEILINEAFANANKFKIGAKIPANFNGRYRDFTVVGTALSPEYVFALRGQSPLPDDKRFGVIFLTKKALAPALNMEGAFNSVSFTILPTANPEAVLANINSILKPYGGFPAYLQKDQLSNFFLTDEVRQQKVMAVALPLIFLSVAAFLLHVIIGRLLNTQREQIATLKALGFSNAEIGLHYFEMVFTIVILGTILGIFFGVLEGRKMTEMYLDFYRLPSLDYLLLPIVPLTAGAVSFVAAFLGAISTLINISRQQPAEAMRPPAPPAYHKGLFDKSAIRAFLRVEERMTLRNLTLNPNRTLLAILGISFAVVVMILGLFWKDTVMYILDVQFSMAQRDDATVAFYTPLGGRALQELKHQDAVLYAEGYRTLPVRLRHVHLTRQTAIRGLSSKSQLRLLLTEDLSRFSLPANGLLLSQILAEKLDLKPGDIVQAEVLEGKRQVFDLPVTGIVDDFVGASAYTEIDLLHRVLGEDIHYSDVGLKVRTDKAEAFYTYLKKLPQVSSVLVKSKLLDTFTDTTAKYILVFAGILIFFSMLIGVGVVYNTARVTLSEKSWELASLRVLGFTGQEVFKIVFGELMIVTTAALPVGCFIGWWLAGLSVQMTQTESFRFPLEIQKTTFLIACCVVIVATIISGLLVRRRIFNLDLVSVLKARE